MKKIVFVLPLMLAALSCFAEIRVDRGGYTTEDGHTVNVAAYWNDKYRSLAISAQQKAKEVAKKLASFAAKSGMNWCGITMTVNVYANSGGSYRIFLMQTPIGFYMVSADYFFDSSNYQEDLYNNSFFSFNDAKTQFDYLCKKYYNEIPK